MTSDIALPGSPRHRRAAAHRHTFLALLLSLWTLTLRAAPDHGSRIYIYHQPDGSSLQVEIFGDEFFAYERTLDGRQVIRDPKTGYCCYARLSDDGRSFVSTGVPVVTAGRRGPQEAPLEAIPNLTLPSDVRLEIVRRNQEANGVDERGRSTATRGTRSAVGGVTGLCILVDFSDREATIPRGEIDDMLNQEAGYTGFNNACSVREYYAIQSSGKLDFQNVVTEYVRVPQPKSYYDDNSGGEYGATKSQELVADALDVLIDQGFDFTQLTIRDGAIQAVGLFYAGEVASDWSKGLWPHKWSIPEKVVDNENGIVAFEYQMSDMTDSPIIGTYCHENGHLIGGFPDLYNYVNGAETVARFSLMGSGNQADGKRHPTNVDPYCKLMAGWADTAELPNGTVTVNYDDDTFYKLVNPDSPNEYFLFENRDDEGYEGPFGNRPSVVPGYGIVIWHIYEGGSNTYPWLVDVDGDLLYEALIVEANPSYVTWYHAQELDADDDDTFHSEQGARLLHEGTRPELAFWDHDTKMRDVSTGRMIRDFSALGPTMTFTASASEPELAVYGRDTEIINGDDEPSLEDGTDFGLVVNDGTTSQRTFTLHNFGSADLLLYGAPAVTLSGPNANVFAVQSPPAAGIPMDGDSTFVIEFHPASAGLKQATVTIANNDTDEGSFTFAIQGTVRSCGVIFVDDTATGAGDGTSWTDAYTDLQQALDDPAGNEIRLAAGTYKPTRMLGDTEQSKAFSLYSGAQVKGGYPDGGGSEEERAPSLHSTILSGDLDGNGELDGGNAWSVFYHPATLYLSTNTVLDGVTITGGNSRGDGGGMYNKDCGTITLIDCTFTGNRAPQSGGGVYCERTDLRATGCTFAGNRANESGGGLCCEWSDVRVANCVFDGNSCESDGGGACVFGDEYSASFRDCTFLRNECTGYRGEGGGLGSSVGTLVVADCTFVENRADSGGAGIATSSSTDTIWRCHFLDNNSEGSGGGFRGSGSESRLVNCVMRGNFAGSGGGGAAFVGDSAVLSNCTIYANSADSGGAALLSYESTATVLNSILWANQAPEDPIVWYEGMEPEFSHCCIEGNYTGQGNFGDDPQLADPANGNLHLTDSSPCQDAGDPNIDYTTDIAGRGHDIGGPDIGAYEFTQELLVTGNGQEIVDNDTEPSPDDDTDFGHLSVGGSAQRTFVIMNIGDRDLALPGTPTIDLQGNEHGAFSVVQYPNATIGPGLSNSLVLACSPATPGQHQATVILSTNDGDENPFTFRIQGTAGYPEIMVKGNGVEIPNGDTEPGLDDYTDFGSTIVGNTVQRIFAIRNVGDAGLVLTGTPAVELLDNEDDAFRVAQRPATPISPGFTTEFYLVYNPPGIGQHQATIRIANDDSDENPFTFAVRGGSVGVPEIAVTGNAEDIANGDNTPTAADMTDFGPAYVEGGSVRRFFHIRNSGTRDLALTGEPLVAVIGAHPDDFVVDLEPDPSIPPGGSSTFAVTFDPGKAGARSATLSIANDDADENPFWFTLQGEGGQSEIAVEGNGVDIANNDLVPSLDDHTDFGDLVLGEDTVTRTFTIRNGGNASLIFSDDPPVAIVGTHANDFAVMTSLGSSIPAFGSATFSIRLTPSDRGLRVARVNIASNDADEGLFEFRIKADVPAPEMLVEGNGREIIAGDDLPSVLDGTSFGLEPAGVGTSTRTFTIRNTGDAPLRLNAVPTVLVFGQGGFTVIDEPDTLIPVAGETTFSVRFRPQAVGQRTATVSIGNTDADEGPYEFAIQGIGSSVLFVDDTADGDDDGSSWEDAFTNLQSALEAATVGDLICVAAGSYYPSVEAGGTGARYQTFQLVGGVTIQGGYPDGGGTEDERDPAANPTVLSGDLDGNGSNDPNNCYHVFYHPEGTKLDASAVLDGVTITHGYADGTDHAADGGGMVNASCHPTLRKVTFLSNYAGGNGGALRNSASNPSLTGCLLQSNSASSGGAVYSDVGSTPTFDSCIFSRNYVSSNGGSVCNVSSLATFTNCVLQRNSASRGGAVYNWESSSTFVNCTLHKNYGYSKGGGICNYEHSEPTLTNCILWDNTSTQISDNTWSTTSATYSCIQDGFAGEGNLALDPLFVDPDNDDLHLQFGSSCFDAGTAGVAPSVDADGTPRDPPPDIGAYEYMATYPGAIVFDLTLVDGWNMISVPIEPFDPSVDAVLKGLNAGPVWGWTGGHYADVSAIVPGEGYWVYYIAPASGGSTAITLTGLPAASVERALTGDWHMVGPIGMRPYADVPLPLVEDPPTALPHPMWGWNVGVYLLEETALEMGHGYWGFWTQPCTVKLGE